MLVLARKNSETIVINGNIRITILRIKGSSVQVGIEAPREVLIRRAELEAAQTPVSAAQVA